MSGAERLMLWIEQMAEATGSACSYVEGLPSKVTSVPSRLSS